MYIYCGGIIFFNTHILIYIYYMFKGGRCLINCIGGSKIWMHNAVVSALAKRINGKGFVATPQESTIHQTVRKQADITVIRQTDVSKPLYVDVTVVQQESNLKSATKLKLTKSDHIVTCEDLEGKFVSRNHIFRKGTSRKLKLTLKLERKKFLKEANLNLLCTPLQWTLMEAFVTRPSSS